MPGNASSAASSASRLSRSRWFVGSSRTRKFAPEATTSASARRRRSPPESAVTGFSCSVPAGEEEAPEQVLRVGPLQAGRRLRAVEHAAALVELDLVLGEVRGLDAVAEPDRPAGGLAVAEHRLEQRRLARAVRADQRDVLAALDRERRVLERCLSPAVTSRSSASTHRAAAARRLEELEAERLAAPRQQRDLARRLRPLLLQAGDLRQLRLRLLGLRLLVAEPLDEALEPRDVARRRGRRPSTARAQRARPSRGATRATAPGSRSSGRPRARAWRSSSPRGTSGRARRG